MKILDNLNVHSALKYVKALQKHPKFAPVPEHGGVITYLLTEIADVLYHRTCGFLESVENLPASKHADFNTAIRIRTESRQYLEHILVHSAMKFTPQLYNALVHLLIASLEREIAALIKLENFTMVEGIFHEKKSTSTNVSVAKSSQSNNSEVHLAY